MTNSRQIWDEWCHTHQIASCAVPLFDTAPDGSVRDRRIGKGDGRRILRRHPAMESLILNQTEKLIIDWEAKQHRYDGIVYMMFHLNSDGSVLPRYIGKAETLGKKKGNLSANLKSLQSDKGKFARWGDNYAYHIGDLSAAVLPGHAPSKLNRKYEAWGKALFEISDAGTLRVRRPVFFWAKAWQPVDIGIWSALRPTRLAFLEYLLIGVASAAFGDLLLNYEGHNRNLKVEDYSMPIK